MTAARFPLGRVVATPNALNTLTPDDILSGLSRHVTGDWGEIDAEDRQANETALIEGTRPVSVYCSSNGLKFWIITEADRSATTVLLPEDY